MWPFTRRPKPEPERDVVERLDDIEDTTRHLERRFIRLQQQFTRWAREFEDEIEPEDDLDDDDIIDEINKRRTQHG